MSEPFLILREWIPPENLNWGVLSENSEAIHILEQNLDKIYWPLLSSNPKAIHLISEALEKNPNKICWIMLSQNTAIFTYDYKQIAEHRWPINKEIIQNRFHPKNMKYFSGWGIEEFDDYEE